MKHIAIRSLSLRRRGAYTVPGLGDRLHAVLIGYNYSILNNTQVTIHLTSDKYFRPDKKASWHEILELLPKDRVFVQGHDVKELKEHDWLRYLREKGFDAKTHCYRDYPHQFEFPPELTDADLVDAGELMNHYPCIEPIVDNIKLPEKFVTAQFDCNNVPYYQDNNDGRKIPSMKVLEILSKWKSDGYEVVFIGGDGNPNMKGPGNLKNIGYAMSNADYHIGAESGFLVMAQMYKKPENIILYSKKTHGYISHHRARNIANGVKQIEV